MSEELEKLRHKQYVAERKLTAAKHKEKRLQSELKRLTRSERTHRLCTRAGMLETFLKEPTVLTDEDVMELLTFIFQSEAVQKMSSIPLGENLIQIQRGLTTSSTAIFVPFTVQELLTYENVHEFIDRILIHELDRETNTRKIEIHYSFVGQVDTEQEPTQVVNHDRRNMVDVKSIAI